MDDEQQRAKWNRVRARRGGVPTVPPDVEVCHVTCDDPDFCYINGCNYSLKREKEKA